MFWAAGCWPIATESWVGSQASTCGICVLVALGKVFIQVLQFCPVSCIPQVLHTLSFIYHRYCVILAIHIIIK